MNSKQKIQRRADSLMRKTDANFYFEFEGKRYFSGKLKEIRACEARNGLVWDGAAGTHRKDAPGRIVKSKSGSWGRETRTSKGLVVAALSEAECRENNLVPGPANI